MAKTKETNSILPLSERIIEFRANNNLTQKEFADRVGVCSLTIWRAENGDKVNKVSRIKIEKVIGKSEV